MTGRRGSLALRISLLATVVAVITAVVAGGLSIGLVRQANQQGARQTLARVAEDVRADLDAGAGGGARARVTLRALKINVGTIARTGIVRSGNQTVRDALTQTEITRVLAGGSVSAARTVDGHAVLVEARSTDVGGVVLVQTRADAVAVGDRAVRRIVLALAIAVAIAIALGLFVAWRMARPLRRTAQAAHALASGRRDVVVEPGGPTEVAEVADALNVLAGNLAHSEARQREFLLSVSHDLRTPLTAITGYAESLADGIVRPEEASRVGAIVLGEAHRLDRLVGDLLDLARLDASDFRIDLVEVDLVELARSAGVVWSTRCAAAGVVFATELPAHPLSVRSDALRLRQALDGLFDNALRVTPAGRPIVLAVGAGPGPDGQGRAYLEVRDGGPGLSDDDLGVAFERSVLYDRYRGVRQVGTGLGLAIVHGLITRLGGSVAAGHAAEGGARFSIALPV